MRAIIRRSLNDFQNLIALFNGIVIGVHDVQIKPEALGGFPRCRGLFLLVIVVVGWDRD